MPPSEQILPIAGRPEDQPPSAPMIVKKNGNVKTSTVAAVVAAVVLAIGVMMWFDAEQGEQDRRINDNEKCTIKIESKVDGLSEDFKELKGEVRELQSAVHVQSRKFDAIMIRLGVEPIEEGP